MHDSIGSGAHGVPENKQAALVIAVLALLLAYSDIMGSRTSTSEIRHNIEASNLWAQYQAKSTRKKLLDLADQQLDILAGNPGLVNPEAAARLRRTWAEDIEHYESDGKSRDGRADIAAKARLNEKLRDQAGFANDLFEYSSSLLHLAIVLASASVLVSKRNLLWVSFGAGVVSASIMISGFVAFNAVPNL